jgi:hypothetical protein
MGDQWRKIKSALEQGLTLIPSLKHFASIDAQDGSSFKNNGRSQINGNWFGRNPQK